MAADEEISDEIAQIVAEKIENLRPRLLDLTARNPLIRVRLSHNSNSYLRVVDELPDVLFFRLSEGKSMKFSALPPIEDEPQDEKTDAFRDAVAAARVNDEAYRMATEALDPNEADYLDQARKLERTLKDRIRDAFDLPARPTGKDVSSLSAHAKAHGITPAYDLPDPAEESDDGRHTDDEIQTLQLPRDLERRMNAMISKGRTWQQETGINVVQAAFGLLEWTDPSGRDNNMSPLLVLPVSLKAKKSPNGTRFEAVGAGESAESNGVLIERLKRDFGIDLPRYGGGSVEDYFGSIVDLQPGKIRTWRVRRQVVFGIFPSARIAMYHDLDTSTTDFASNEIVKGIMAGIDPSGVSPFSDEHDIDAMGERGDAVPLTVMDADSSQLSTMIDVAAGKNLAVEGPPGTGKSQTIVNVIAAALAEGKKVLFVAEKLAALEVVRSRLDAVGLGDFTLPLQADRSSRQDVARSLCERLSLAKKPVPVDYENTRRRLQDARSRLCGYVKILSSRLPDMDCTVHQALGRAIATQAILEELPAHIRDTSALPDLVYDETTIGHILVRAEELDSARTAAMQTGSHWKGMESPSLTPIAVDEILESTKAAISPMSSLCEVVDECRERHIPPNASVDELETIVSVLSTFRSSVSDTEIRGWAGLLDCEKRDRLKRLSEAIGEVSALRERLSQALRNPESEANRASVIRAVAICRNSGFRNPDPGRLEQETEKLQRTLQAISQIRHHISAFEHHHDPASRWTLNVFHEARALVFGFPREVLALRSRESRDAAADGAMKALIARGTALAARKQELSSAFIFNASVTGNSLRQTLAVIKNAGVLSFLSADMRTARRRYLSLSRKISFDKDTAVSELIVLAELVEREAEFTSDPNCRTVFGLHFRGLETKFDLFSDLITYYERVDATFPGPDHRDIRDFLKTAKTDLLLALPDTAGLKEQMTACELDRVISLQQSKLDAAQEERSELESSVSVLIDPAVATVQGLERILNDMDALENLLEAIDIGQAELGLSDNGGTKREPGSARLQPWIDFLDTMIDQEGYLRAVQSSALAGELPTLSDLLDRLLECSTEAEKIFLSLSQRTGMALESPMRDPAAALVWSKAAANDRTGLRAHMRVARARQAVDETGFGKVAEQLMEHRSDVENIHGIIDALIARYRVRQVYERHGKGLEGYTGEALCELRSRFSQADRKMVELSRTKLVAGLVETANPPPGCGIGRKADYTEMALVWNETEKKKRHIPVRDLLRRAGRAVLELKPCWMMSPQAVAQYLPSDALQFDLCIIDEASQMPPEDAIGALYRSHQAMIVGDTNQLPPTSFFRKMLDDEIDDDAETETVLEESVLEIAKATFRPARRLRWHYRSKHSSLIRFCNRIIYQDDLVVFPSPLEQRPGLGVFYKHVKGRYNSGLNSDEARIVVEAIVDFMRDYPDRSLGAVALNKKQADYIREMFDNDIALVHGHVRKYLDRWEEQNDGLESFFVKNLENVQGDERDVIFISTVYGPETPGGAVMQRFGPINGLAGQRRLNVLFSRAKMQIVTFSSMTSADITADENGNKGTWMLKRWLEYCASGTLEGGASTDREPDSEFEHHVIEQIKAMGCDPVPQVGVAGYFIDIGVKHEDWPHGYILGVECDGAAYHSSRSARDRDRLRQEVLEDNYNWKLYRIWSTDWFADPRRQIELLRAAITDRLEELKATEKHATQKSDYVFEADSDTEDLPLPTPSPEERPISSSEGPEPGDVERPFDIDQSHRRIEIGDTVRIRYLSHGNEVIQVTISRDGNDIENGMIGYAMPLAEALLDAQEGDEIEILKGSYLRSALIEKVTKGTVSQ